MKEDTKDRPFPVPPYGEIGGPHVADLEPQTSASAGGRRRLQGGLRRLSRQVAALEQWWQEAEPALAGDLDPEERRRLLREARGQLALFPGILEGLDTTLTTLASVNAVAASDDELRGLFDQAVRWNLGWAFRPEEAAAGPGRAHPVVGAGRATPAEGRGRRRSLAPGSGVKGSTGRRVPQPPPAMRAIRPWPN